MLCYSARLWGADEFSLLILLHWWSYDQIFMLKMIAGMLLPFSFYSFIYLTFFIR